MDVLRRVHGTFLYGSLCWGIFTQLLKLGHAVRCIHWLLQKRKKRSFYQFSTLLAILEFLGGPCRGHAHQIPGTAMFKLGELSLFLQFLVVQPMHDPWHEPTKLLEKKSFILEIALTLEAFCSWTKKARDLNLGSFQKVLKWTQVEVCSSICLHCSESIPSCSFWDHCDFFFSFTCPYDV